MVTGVRLRVPHSQPDICQPFRNGSTDACRSTWTTHLSISFVMCHLERTSLLSRLEFKAHHSSENKSVVSER